MPDTLTYAFDRFRLQPGQRRLLEDGVPVLLGARAFDLLVTLVEGRERVLGKEELIRRVWNDSAVEENNLTVTISALRKALGDLSSERRAVRTVSGRGYQFVAEVRVEGGGGPAPARAETASIAVLPFATLGDDPRQEHFGDGIAEDIISELSRNRWLTVIARNSSFTFKGAALDIGDVARKLGVRYVLEGSVRISGRRVRVRASLIDAANEGHLVAERYDREMADIFTVQDEITAQIIQTVRPVLYEAEQVRSMRKHPDSIDAWAAYQRGMWHFSRYEQPESAEAQAWFQRAIDLDPGYAPGHYGMALVYLHDGSGYMPGTVADWQARGERLALRAVELDGRDSGAHSILAVARMVRGDHEGALAATRDALALNPNDATAHGTAGATLVFSERPLEGLEALATCLRLSPRDPRLRVRRAHIGLGYFFSDQHDRAEATAHELIRAWPHFPFGPRLLAMIYGEAGRVAEARAAVAAAVALSPAPFDDFSHARMPWYGAAAHRRAAAALRAAGVDVS